MRGQARPSDDSSNRHLRILLLLLCMTVSVLDVVGFETTYSQNLYRKRNLQFGGASCPTTVCGAVDPSPNGGEVNEQLKLPAWTKPISDNPKRSITFSGLMTVCGAVLGPFLDSYHSAFGVLQYDNPIRLQLWGTEAIPALTTTWWVPELFGLAGFIIGWLYILLDYALNESGQRRDVNNRPTTKKNDIDASLKPSIPKILVGISIFTLQYWLSGILVQNGVDRTSILNFMSVVAAAGFLIFDGTMAGLITSAATAIGGPLIEIGLLTASIHGLLPSGYHYTDAGETGFFPLWIVPVYFLGGPANGNLARGFWNLLTEEPVTISGGTENILNDNSSTTDCASCNGTRRVPCPNCDGIGTYVAMGGRSISCTSCRGRGFVICRSCFGNYEGDPDPSDIDSIRDMMARMPD